MEKYGVLFEKIYSAEGILLYIVSDIKKGHISEKDSYFYDEIDNCYLTIDDFEMTYSNDKFAVGYVKTLEETKKELLSEIIKNIPADKTIVLDADALKLIPEMKKDLSKIKTLILTPHEGESAILLDRKTSEIS